MLTPRQEQFCNEYMIDLNATQAAIRAGYSKKTADVIASRLLANVKVSARVEELKAKRIEKTAITADYVLKGIQEVFEKCCQRVPVMEFNQTTRTIEQATDEEGNGVWQFDSHGANKALEMLGKHVGIFEKDNNQKKQVINVGITE